MFWIFLKSKLIFFKIQHPSFRNEWNQHLKEPGVFAVYNATWCYVALYTATLSGNLDLSVSAENLSIAEVTPVYLWRESGPFDAQGQDKFSICFSRGQDTSFVQDKEEIWATWAREMQDLYNLPCTCRTAHPAGLHIKIPFVIPTAVTVNVCSLQETLYHTTRTCHFQQLIRTMIWAPLTVPQNTREHGGTMTAITPTWMGCTGWAHMGATLMASTGRQAKNTTTPISKRKWSSGQFNMVTGCLTALKGATHQPREDTKHNIVWGQKWTRKDITV